MEWVSKAFSAIGHDVCQAHSINELAEADEDCDLVVFEQRCAGLNYADVAEVASGRRTTWVQWVFDLMATEPGLQLGEQPNLGHRTTSATWEATDTLRMMRLMDLVFVKERGLLAEYANLGVEARWLDQACPSWMGECRHSSSPEFDVCLFANFTTAARQRRVDVQSLLRCRRSIVWAGHPGGDAPPGVRAIGFVPVERLPELASRAAVTLCVDQRHDLDGYVSDRLWLALGMGACVVRRASPGLPGSPGEYYGVYDDGDCLSDVVGALLACVDHRQLVGRGARQYVMANHTYEHRCQELLREVEKCRHQTSGSAAAATAGA
jgi:hypothetical protein